MKGLGFFQLEQLCLYFVSHKRWGKCNMDWPSVAPATTFCFPQTWVITKLIRLVKTDDFQSQRQGRVRGALPSAAGSDSCPSGALPACAAPKGEVPEPRPQACPEVAQLPGTSAGTSV